MLEKSKIDYLIDIYRNDKYPSRHEMENIASKCDEKYQKIENWFKHKRRIEVKRGLLKFEKKHVFSTTDNEYLTKIFALSKHPSQQKYDEISLKLNCHRKNIKNWFSYRRKLFLKSKKNAAIKNPKLQMKKFEEPKIILKEECKEEKNCEHIKTEESSISLKQEENFNENLIKIPVDSSEKIMQMFKLQHYYRAFSYFLCFANQIAIKNMLMSSKNQRY